MTEVTKLIDRLKEELREDLSRYDDDHESWMESALDCPSDTSGRLQSQIIDMVGDEEYETIMSEQVVPFMRSLKK